MCTTNKLTTDEHEKCVDTKKYKCMIGSLLYITTNWHDIMFTVCKYARFQSAHKESHLTVVKRIFNYLRGTSSLGLWYRKGQEFDLVCFLDSDYADHHVDWKSISGTCQFLGSCLVSWFSKNKSQCPFPPLKQNI